MSGRSTKRSGVIGARAIVLRKNAATESVGGREDGSHRRWRAADAPGERGSGREEWRGKGEREEDDGRKQVGRPTRSFPFPAVSRLFKNTGGNNSTVPLALRTSASLSCLSLNTASPATKQAALYTLKDPFIGKDRGEKDNRRKNTPASLVANITPRSFRAVVI